MSQLIFNVCGSPAPQGSKSAFRNQYTGKIQQVESSKKVKPWRQDVKQAAIEARDAAGWQTLTGPVEVHTVFYFRRPNTHYRSGRNAHLLRDAAPAAPANRATYDGDKLTRSTWDALVQAGVFADDAQIARWTGEKRWLDIDHPHTGAHIEVREIQ
jgi:crossover junction endodeoxyribonuclease RusA